MQLLIAEKYLKPYQGLKPYGGWWGGYGRSAEKYLKPYQGLKQYASDL